MFKKKERNCDKTVVCLKLRIKIAFAFVTSLARSFSYSILIVINHKTLRLYTKRHENTIGRVRYRNLVWPIPLLLSSSCMSLSLFLSLSYFLVHSNSANFISYVSLSLSNSFTISLSLSKFSIISLSFFLSLSSIQTPYFSYTGPASSTLFKHNWLISK